eukprot:5982064-Prymnesium_polylepis.1
MGVFVALSRARVVCGRQVRCLRPLGRVRSLASIQGPLGYVVRAPRPHAPGSITQRSHIWDLPPQLLRAGVRREWRVVSTLHARRLNRSKELARPGRRVTAAGPLQQ